MTLMKKARDWLAKSFDLSGGMPWRRMWGGESYSGKTVNARTAMQLSTVWACIRLISETISTLPIALYERDATGDGRQLARKHPLYVVLHDSPNANMTAVEFWEALIAQLCLWGNAYCLISRSVSRVIALDPLRPDLMVPRIERDGSITYCYSDPNGYVEYQEDQIFHIKGFGVNGLVGLSPLSYARQSMGNAMAADEASGRMFKNGMRAGGALTMPHILKPEQRTDVRNNLVSELAGTANTGKLMVLEGGATYTPLSFNPGDAQMLESRAFNIEDMCRWFQVPPAMIGHGSAVSNWGTGREQIMLGFLTFTLRPYLTRIEQAIKKSLLTPAERLRFFAEFSLEGLLRADSAARAAFYASAAQNGWMTRNEIRALENLPALDGGDELTAQSNLVPLSLLGKITSTAQSAKSALLSWLGIEPPKEEHETQT